MLDLERLAGPHCPRQGLDTQRPVFGVRHRQPIIGFALLGPRQLVPSAVEVIQPSIGPYRPHDLGHGISHLTEPGFTFPEGGLIAPQLLGKLALGGIDVDADHAVRLTRRVIHDLAFPQNPPDARIRMDNAEFAFVGAAILDGGHHGVRYPDPVIGVHHAEESLEARVSNHPVQPQDLPGLAGPPALV